MPTDSEIQNQVDSNYGAFQSKLPEILESRQGKFALMRNSEIVEFFDTARDAHVSGARTYEDELFSVQEVSDKAADLGHYSYAVSLG